MHRFFCRVAGFVKKIGSAASIAIGLLFTCTVQADTFSPFRENAHVLTPTNLTRAQTGINSASSRDYDAIPEIRIRTRIRGVGPVSLSFTTRKNLTWNASISRGSRVEMDTKKPLLLQGRARVGSRKQPKQRLLAASIIGNDLKATFSHQTLMKRTRLYTISVKLDGSFSVSARMTSVPESAMAGMACGSENALIGESFSSQAAPQVAQAATGPLKVVTISTEADAEWYAKYGESSNAQIAGIINAADVVYRNQLGVTFRLVKQHVYAGASPFTSLNAGTLLSQFTQAPDNAINLAPDPATFNKDVDLKHLFSGKDFEGSVVGIAYIGVVCTASDAAMGITQDYGPSITWGIFAHEVGHNFGATHDASDRTSLMYPSISMPPSNTFSTFSRTEIDKHLFEGGNSCMDLVQGEIPPLATAVPEPTPGVPVIPTPEVPLPPPDPTETPTNEIDPEDVYLSLQKQRIDENGRSFFRLSGRLRRASGAPYSNVVMDLVAEGQLVGRSRTRADGRYIFFVEVRVPLSERLTVWVETHDGSAASNTVRLKRVPVRRDERR